MPTTTILVSIPNGMEFYDVVWRCRLFNTYVSIPNGMEFYQFFTFFQSAQICFNSQRDGILPHAASVAAKAMPSFNSQRDGILPTLGFCADVIHSCFNSQRDGILHDLPLWRLLVIKVSIPNGMEFYKRKYHNSKRVFLQFQFPTGWNSTQTRD